MTSAILRLVTCVAKLEEAKAEGEADNQAG